MFLGYPFEKKWSKVYDIKTGDMFVSRDVIFYEESFPFIDQKEADNFVQKENNHIWEFSESQHPWVDSTGDSGPSLWTSNPTAAT